MLLPQILLTKTCAYLAHLYVNSKTTIDAYYDYLKETQMR